MELKPCPFCGSEAETEVGYISVGGGEMVLRASVFCKSCGCSKMVKFEGLCKPFSEYTENFKAAVDMWNRRANDVCRTC